MIDYRTVFTNTDGVIFPNTKAINVTTPGAGDGTEFIAAGVNDSWGFHQALMNHAGLTPDTVTEAPVTSQMLEAMRLCFSYPGEVVPWHGAADPSTLTPAPRLLLLKGQGVQRVNYSLLDAAVYIGDVNNPNLAYQWYYHADDQAGTSRNPVGDWLILADARGLVLRGDDPTALRDPQGASRKFPDIQLQALIQHGHYIQANDNNNYTDKMNFNAAPGTDVYWDSNPSQTSGMLEATGVLNATVDANETRMINEQVRWCIRY
jgi:hypothetical protein